MKLKRSFIDSVVTCLSWAGLPGILRQFQNEEFCILMLHGITDRLSSEESGIGNTEGLHMHVQDFDAICQLLSENYRVVSLGDVVRSMENREALPTGSVVITFDDGYRSNQELGFKVLDKYGLPATVFLATNFVENREWLWWDRIEFALGHTDRKHLNLEIGGILLDYQFDGKTLKKEAFQALLKAVKSLPQEDIYEVVAHLEDYLGNSLANAEIVPEIYKPLTWDGIREMQTSGLVEFGAHTHTHKILGRCQAATVRNELTTCRDLLSERIGVESPLFSYPNGHVGDHTRETRRALIDLGFRCGLTTETGFNSIDSDPFTLKRFSTGNSSHYVNVAASGTMRILLAMNGALRGKRAA